MTSNISNPAITSLEGVLSINLATFSEPTGDSLTVVQAKQDVPFSIARIFYIYACGEGCERGAHAHRQAEQVFIAISGKFSLGVTNGFESTEYVLQQPNRAIYVPAMIWTRVYDFSKDAVCLVLTNLPYDEGDYIRHWGEYLATGGKGTL